MKKIVLAAAALFVSFNVSATPNNLGSELAKKLDKQAVSNQSQNSTIVYGGKDLSRSIVAIAHEPTWTKEEPTLLG